MISSRSRKLALATLMVGVAAMLTSCYGRYYSGDSDFFQNFDNDQTSSSVNTRDWGVHFLFYGAKARVDTSGSTPGVKGKLDAYGYGDTGGTKYLALKDANDGDGRGIHADSDQGRKGLYQYLNECSSFAKTNRHMRVYADNTDDRMTNSQYGNYVVATVHYDVNENASCQKFGWNEQAEGEFANRFDNDYWVCRDCLKLNNEEAFYESDGSFHDSDGYATLVSMP